MATKETINKGWTPTTVGTGAYVMTKQAENDAIGSATVAPVTDAISAETKLSGSKILVFIDVNTPSGVVGTTDVFMEMSADGVNWTTHENTGQNYITLETAFNHNATGIVTYIADLESFRSPYYRIGFNSGGNTMATALRFQMGYAYAK